MVMEFGFVIDFSFLCFPVLGGGNEDEDESIPQVGQTKYGNPCLIWKGRMYIYDSSSARKAYWKCKNNRQCKSRVHQTVEGVYTEVGSHSLDCFIKYSNEEAAAAGVPSTSTSPF